MKMVIGVSGLGYTGSGAVVDLLKEYEGLNVYDENEFWLAFGTDGLEDLRYHLFNPSRFMDSDIAILRFIEYVRYTFRARGGWGRDVSDEVNNATKDFLSKIVQVEWKGTWGRDLSYDSVIRSVWKWHICQKLSRYIREKSNGKRVLYPYRTMYLSICPAFFDKYAKEYVEKLFGILGYEGDKIVLNQPFCADHPERSFRFFNDPKVIVVDKDPRDLYFLCKKEIKANTTWMPTDNVKSFVEYYKMIRSSMDYSNTERILHIRFEELIYDYERVLPIIEEFLGLDRSNHKKPRTSFIPEKSINNTQLFRKHAKYISDTKYIEDQLPEFLFPFEKYAIKDSFGESF